MPLRQIFPDPTLENPLSDFKVDIIAVHGLNPRNTPSEKHAWNTWSTPGKDRDILWLRDDLPKFTPSARIFLYQYESRAFRGGSHASFMDKANELIQAISLDREDPERPLVFLAHSLGGLLVKQALINAQLSPKYNNIVAATTGLAFFGTPHSGASKGLVAIASVASKLALDLGLKKGEDIIDILKENSMFSTMHQELWRNQLLNYKIVSFWGSQDDIVPKGSAKFGLSDAIEDIVMLNGDHHTICRFGELQVDKDNLKIVQSFIATLYERALEAGICIPSNQTMMMQQLLENNASSTHAAIQDMVQKSTERICTEIKISQDNNPNSKEALISFIKDTSCFELLRQARSKHLVEASEQFLLQDGQWLANRKKQNTGKAESVSMAKNLGDHYDRNPSPETLTVLFQIQRQMKGLAQSVDFLAKSPLVARDHPISAIQDKSKEISELILYLARGIRQLLTYFWLQHRHVRQFFSVGWSVIRSCTPLLQNDIQFEDVLGRMRRLPYEHFRHWQVFSAMLRCEFKGLPGESQVLAGNYQIMSTNQTRRLIMPELWEGSITPGSKIAMAVVLEHLPFLRGICPKCGGVAQSIRGHYDKDQGLQYKQCLACSFIISQSAAISTMSRSQQKLDKNKVIARNNIEASNPMDTEASPPAMTTTENIPGLSGSSDSKGLDFGLKVFRRIHFFEVFRHWTIWASKYSEVSTIKKVKAIMCTKVRISHPGFVYLSFDPRYPDFIQMGSTINHPEMRLKQWLSRCRPLNQVVPDFPYQPVSHLNRLEQLLHTDLLVMRKRYFCQKCNCDHTEIFEVTQTLAIATVQLWRKWMETEPYDEVGELKKHWKQKIQGPNSPATREQLYAMLKDG